MCGGEESEAASSACQCIAFPLHDLVANKEVLGRGSDLTCQEHVAGCQARSG